MWIKQSETTFFFVILWFQQGHDGCKSPLFFTTVKEWCLLAVSANICKHY